MDKYFANAKVPTEANTTNVIVFDVLEAIVKTHSKRNTPTYFKLLLLIIIFERFKLLLSFPFAFPDEAFPVLELNFFVFDALSGSSKLEFMKLFSFRDTAPPGKEFPPPPPSSPERERIIIVAALVLLLLLLLVFSGDDMRCRAVPRVSVLCVYCSVKFSFNGQKLFLKPTP
jgi:hypothetical protein